MNFVRRFRAAAKLTTPAIAATVISACQPDTTPPLIDPEQWHTVAEYEIGGLIGETEQAGETPTFERITGMRVSRDGAALFVLDPGRTRVTGWSPDGSLLFELGNQGESAVALESPDQIHLTDTGFQVQDNDRFVLFSSDGQHEQTVSVPTSARYVGFRLQPQLLLDGGALLATLNIPDSYRAGWQEDPPILEEPVVRLDRQGDDWAPDTVAVLDIRNRDLDLRPSESGYGWSLHALQPFGDADHVDFRAGDFRAGGRANTLLLTRQSRVDPGVIELNELSSSGDTLWSGSLRFEPIPLLPAHVDRAVEAEAQGIAGAIQLSLDDARTLVREAVHVPQYYPPVLDTEVMSNGELWIRNHEEPADSLDVWYAVRIGEDAAPRRILVPRNFYPLDATASHVWGVRFDPASGQSVAGRRLVRGGAELG